MKLKSIAIFSTIMMAGVGSANANNLLIDPYVGAMAGFGGYTVFHDHEHASQSSQIYGAVAGIDIPLFRLEAEYEYLNADDFHTNLGMLNAYVKAPTVLIKPYLGVGVGTAFSGKFDDIKTENTIAYQAMLGITLDMPVLPFKVDVEGRVLYANDIVKDDNIKPDLLQYDARAKLRFIF